MCMFCFIKLVREGSLINVYDKSSVMCIRVPVHRQKIIVICLHATCACMYSHDVVTLFQSHSNYQSFTVLYCRCFEVMYS